MITLPRVLPIKTPLLHKRICSRYASGYCSLCSLIQWIWIKIQTNPPICVLGSELVLISHSRVWDCRESGCKSSFFPNENRGKIYRTIWFLNWVTLPCTFVMKPISVFTFLFLFSIGAGGTYNPFINFSFWVIFEG